MLPAPNVTCHGNFYVTATDPAGEWYETIWVDMGGIDPSLTLLTKAMYILQQTWVHRMAGPAYRAEINPETGKLISEIRFYGQARGRAAEAPHLYAIGGLGTYLIAEGGSFPYETIARNKSPGIESCPHNPIPTNIHVQTPGVHCIWSRGIWWRMPMVTGGWFTWNTPGSQIWAGAISAVRPFFQPSAGMTMALASCKRKQMRKPGFPADMTWCSFLYRMKFPGSF